MHKTCKITQMFTPIVAVCAALVGCGGSNSEPVDPNAATREVAEARVDKRPPSLAIVDPTSTSVFSTVDKLMIISGTATDDRRVASVTWANDRGGTGIAVLSGTATTVSWTAGAVPLPDGVSAIVLRAYDGAGKSTSQTLTVNSTPAPAPAPAQLTTVTNWVSIANQQHRAFTASGVVRYGHPAKPNTWVSKTINGASTCDGSTFGNVDPAPGLYKECQVQVSAPNVVQTGGLPVINIPLLPPPQKGFSTEKVVNGGSFDAGPFDIGAFRTTCAVSHFAFDDPIVFPGQPGRAHLHMFFGNTGVNGNSTAASIASSGDSTCAGGTLNRSAYWVPAMVDMKTGAPVVPSGSIWYYKSAYYGVPAESIKPLPAGLRMIAGSAANTPAGGANPYVRIGCAGSGTYGPSIPNCAVGGVVEIGIQFPQCWDGVNLDSPDHKSHMAYANNGCPGTHPVPLVEISLNASFTVTEARPDLNWKLSSDNYVGTGGYSMHADWFDGWKDDIMKTWVTRCINSRASSSNAICDGRYLN